MQFLLSIDQRECLRVVATAAGGNGRTWFSEHGSSEMESRVFVVLQKSRFIAKIIATLDPHGDFMGRVFIINFTQTHLGTWIVDAEAQAVEQPPELDNQAPTLTHRIS